LNSFPAPNQPATSTLPANPGLDGPAERLIRSLVGKTLAYFLAHEDAHISRIQAHLLTLLDARLSPQRAQNLRSAHALLHKSRAIFTREFRSALQSTLHEALRGFLHHGSGARPEQALVSAPSKPLGLSLVDIGDVERDILLDRVSQGFALHYDASMRPLTLRLARLLGRDASSLAANPFHPAVFIKAFMLAWEQAALDDHATQDLMQSLDPLHSLDLAPLYVELDTVLMQVGLPAHSTHRIKKSDASNAPSHPRPPSAATSTPSRLAVQPADAPSPSDAPSPAPVLTSYDPLGTSRQFLQRLGWLRANAMVPGNDRSATQVDLPAADTALLSHLADLQAGASDAFGKGQTQDPAERHVLRQLQRSAHARRAPALDRGALDTLSEVFDFVFADQAIPAQMKSVIGRLQIPILKAAMLERDFFLCTEHPARRLVDTLALASIAWAPEKGEGDVLYQRVQTTVQRVLGEFEQDTTLFGDLLLEFTEFLFETEQQAERLIEPVKDAALVGESLEQALVHADQVIHARLRQASLAQPLTPYLVPFLSEQWRQVMARAWLSRANHPAIWERALATMHQLIWSTQPKTRSDERQQLVVVLPELVRNLNAGLDSIQWSGDERATFTRRLIATHMMAIRAAKVQPPDAEDAARVRDAGQAAIASLEQRRAAQRADVLDEFDATAQGLTRGLWFDIVMDDGSLHRRRLSWVSPMRSRFLFTNREGSDAFVRSEREVAALLRANRLKPIDVAPIVSRALEHLIARVDGQPIA
jgi:Protein of unknown function (DUF1631)